MYHMAMQKRENKNIAKAEQAMTASTGIKPLNGMPEDGNYAEWIKSIKERVRQARLRALTVANTEQLLLYWDIGDEIRTKQQHFGWGAKIVGQMSRDLRNEFPGMAGWSRSNLMYMRLFAASWRRNEIVQAPLGQLPWYHQIALMEQLKSRTDRLAYAALAVENGWSRNVLVHHIELGTAKSGGKALTNFKTTLPPQDSDLAQDMLKGKYDLGFLNATDRIRENELRGMLVDRVAQFILELGAGFSYVGKAVKLDVGGDEFELDLLFYHLVLHRYVVIELKTEKFKPEHLGQLSFYMTAVDKQIKGKIDGKTLGLLLCKSRNKVVVEYVLSDLRKPMGVSTYNLGLPPLPQLEAKLSVALAGGASK